MAKPKKETGPASSNQQQHLPLVWDGAGKEAVDDTAPTAAPDGDAVSATEDLFPAPTGPVPTTADTDLPETMHDEESEFKLGPSPQEEEDAPPLETNGSEESAPADSGDATGTAEAGTVIRLPMGDLSLSEMMVDARGAANLTRRQTIQKTNVPAEFIESIEAGAWADISDDFYARVYVNRLCEAYQIDPGPVLERLEEKLDEHADEDGGSGFGVAVGEGTDGKGPQVYHLPRTGMESEDEGGVPLARWIISLSLAALILLVAGGLGIQWWRGGDRKASPDEVEAADQTHVLDLEQFMPPQQLPLKELPVPRSRLE